MSNSYLCTNPRCDGSTYLCGKCRKLYPNLAATLDENRRQGKQNRNRGTMGSTSFRSVPQRNDPNVNNHYFNSPGDGGAHGHVKEQSNPDGSKSYPFIRDVEGTTYETKE